MNVLETHRLGKRYRHNWALRDCTLAIPAGRIVALAGPNGAGKTTLLHLAVGLLSPTEGDIFALGGTPRRSAATRSRIGFVAQSAPLYANLSVADTLHFARNLNPGWDQPYAQSRLGELAIPLARKVGKLSGGQQAQVALTVALAKHPELLILDEPMASLDPLARHEFMASLMTGVAESGVSIVFSSHVVSELERLSDYLILLSNGQLQLAGDVDRILAEHRMFSGPVAESERYQSIFPVVFASQTASRVHLLVRAKGFDGEPPPGWELQRVSMEEVILAYLRTPGASALPGPSPLPAVTSPAVTS